MAIYGLYRGYRGRNIGLYRGAYSVVFAGLCFGGLNILHHSGQP